MNHSASTPLDLWNTKGRALVFLLAFTSIGCLLVDFYGLFSMRLVTFYVLVPAMLGLMALALIDRQQGKRRLWKAIVIGTVAGLGAAVAYDLFRLPFVYATQWGIDWLFPSLNLFKVFPRFGAMILGQAVEQPSYSLAAQLIGWAYHFSNGLTFGVMYVAAVGDARLRSWLWAVLMALTLEVAMLMSPYPTLFQIRVSPTFIGVTLAAHLIFGVALGLTARALSAKYRAIG